MLVKSLCPTYKSSDRSFTNTGKIPPPKAKILNLKENPAGNSSSIKKTAAVLTSITSLGFGTKYVVDNDLDIKALLGKIVEWGSDNFISPNSGPSNPFAFVGLAAGSLVAIGAASAAYFKNQKTSKSPIKKTVSFKPQTSAQIKPTYTPPKKPPMANQSSNQSSYTASEIANTSRSTDSSPTSSPPCVFGVQLKSPTKKLQTPKDKIELENQEKERRKEELKKLSPQQLRKSAEAVKLFNPINLLDKSSENPEVIKIQWLDLFKVIINETNSAELSKILVETILNASDDDFKLYSKNETFWTQITSPRLNKAAIYALSVEQMELLVSYVMSETNIDRSFELNLLLSCLSDYQPTDKNSRDLYRCKLEKIAECGHPNLDEFVLGLASRKLSDEDEITFAKIRKAAKESFYNKCKEDSLAYQTSQNAFEVKTDNNPILALQ